MREVYFDYPIPGVEDMQAQLLRDGETVSDWVTMVAFTEQGIHAGYKAQFLEESATPDAAKILSVSEDLATMKSLKIDYIYGRFTFNPPNRPAIVVPAASDPDMVTLVVQLRDAPTMKNGLKVVASMLEPGNVYLDGAHEVDKTYEGVTGEYTDEDGVTHQGVALVEVFASTKLEEAEYNPLYRVVAPGVRRTVWVPEGGGELGELPETKPEE